MKKSFFACSVAFLFPLFLSLPAPHAHDDQIELAQKLNKQVVELFDVGDSEAIKGMSPVFCFFGGGGELGLLAFLVSSERVVVQGRDYNMVIVPTAPVPFGGALLFIPSDRIVPADMTVDAMMSIYLSMGVSGPEYLPRGGA